MAIPPELLTRAEAWLADDPDEDTRRELGELIAAAATDESAAVELSDRLQVWRRNGRDVALLVGGPDGLHSRCLERAEARWSLSALTLPHGLVRVLVAEQIYRAWTLITGHPYHRE